MTAIPERSPSEQSTVRALARLLPFARPVLPRLILGGVSAMLASVLALMFPLVLEAIVGGPIASGDPGQIVWGAVAVLVLGLAEAAMVWARRWFVLAPSTRVEYALRTTFYRRLQRLPVAFHDRSDPDPTGDGGDSIAASNETAPDDGFQPTPEDDGFRSTIEDVDDG